MEYLLLMIACSFFSVQFIFSKSFESRTVGSLTVCFWNQMICCLCGQIFMIVKSGLPTGLTLAICLFAAAYAASGMLCGVCSLTAMGCGRVSTVTTFCLAGGMVVPFLYGIIALGEENDLFKWLGLAVLCLSLLPSFLKKTDGEAESVNKLKFALNCTVVFLTNGMISVISKMYMNHVQRTETDPIILASAEDNFLKTSGLIQLIAAAVILFGFAFAGKMKGKPDSFRNTYWEIGVKKMTLGFFILLITLAAGYTVCNVTGNLFSLRCMNYMDASIQFPLLSATVIVLTAVLSRVFFKEKFTGDTVLSLFLSAAGIALFMIPG
ncbi:MAG: hypothetical protein IKQ92_12580 [Clostridia bacterium]|nr:hypothetical protein [Clostridia bacterium]